MGREILRCAQDDKPIGNNLTTHGLRQGRFSYAK